MESVHAHRDADDLLAGVQLGEVHTGLLQSSFPITAEIARSVLATLPHQPVRSWERPIRHALSPEILTGIDHALPSRSGAIARGVGTLGTELRVTAGRLLQATTRATVIPSRTTRRLAWSYYLARPAVVEAIGRFAARDVAQGFLRGGTRGDFDLGPVCARWMSWVQAATILDHRSPFAAPRVRLRWIAVPGTPSQIVFRLQEDHLRTVWVVAPGELMASVSELCQDLALHDWLLSSLISLIDKASIGHRDRDRVLKRLCPAVDHLVHAWMPAARSRDEVIPFWKALERSSGLTRQWDNSVNQVRDQITLAAAMGVAPDPPGARHESPGERVP